MSDKLSPLGPVDAGSLPSEEEKEAPWIIRKLVGSMTGRIVMSSYESLRAAGTNITCLSSWGDSSPLFLPCIRFRDLATHTVITATGGMAAVVAPAMGPISDVMVASLGDTILVEVGLHAGFELATKAANDLFLGHTVNELIPIHSDRLETTGLKTLLITLKFKHIMDDAALGFYRSSLHKIWTLSYSRDISLFSSIKDYLAVEKGWFSPYLYASARRPVIPRSMKPDIVFCHGPFLSGDYKIGETLLSESASAISFCDAPAPPQPLPSTPESTVGEALGGLRFPSLSIPPIRNRLSHSRTPSPDPELPSSPPQPAPRRVVVLLVGLKPHRKLWSTSARPGESVINYILFNGCPAVVIPVRVGAPLVAWDGLTLEQLWQVKLPERMERATPVEMPQEGISKFHGIVQVLFEYLDLCIDWDRVKIPSSPDLDGSGMILVENLEDKKKILRNSLALLVAAAIRSGCSKVVKEVDKERSGIAMWRIP